MADTTPLQATTDDIKLLIDKEMSEYFCGAYADHGSARSQLEYFARAVLAAMVAQQPVERRAI